MKTITLNSYSDPGHGWLKCKRKLLVDLGIADKISYFSYQRNDDVFLEEDCDVSVFMDAMRARGVEVKFRHYSSNKSSRIRNYRAYTNN